jgi:hypothetical protein
VATTGAPEIFKEQLRELIENYDPAVLWFDGDMSQKVIDFG